MGLSVREIRLIEALLRHPAGLTADDLADRLGVSARTVRRDLPAASLFLEGRGLSLVARSGRGVRVEGPEGAREGVSRTLGGMTAPPEPTPEERRAYLLRALLSSGQPIKLRALASRQKVSVGTVSRDLDGVEEWLDDLRLALVRRRGYGVEVTGAEADLRLAMRRLLLQESPAAPAYDAPGRLLGLVDEDRMRRVEAMTAGAVGGLPYAIADSALVDLGVHVALMVERLLGGHRVEMGREDLLRLRGTVEWETARGLGGEIEEEFGVRVPEEEVAYLTVHLRGTKLRGGGGELERYFESADLEVASKVSALVHYVEQQTGVVLAGDSLLYTGLLAHVERAIHRVRENLSIYNPLLADVKEDYPALFDLVGGGMRKVFAGESIPDEEVGFVAMHFGAALDRGQGAFPSRVLVICDSGIASSRMLASRLETAFPQIRQLVNASLIDLEGLETEGFDLVVSTVPLPLPRSRYVQVRPLLSAEEEDRIRDHLRERRVRTNLADRAVTESLEILGGGQEKFRQMAEATQTIAELMEDFFLARHEARGSVPEAVRLMCLSLAERDLVSDPRRLQEALLARLEIGGIGIPGTTLALFHARDDAVLRPSFSAHDLDEPLEIEGMDGEPVPVRRSMLMVAPLELSSVALEAISEISVAMVERPAELEVFQLGTQERVTAALQEVFGRYLQNKLT